MQPGKSRMPMS